MSNPLDIDRLLRDAQGEGERERDRPEATDEALELLAALRDGSLRLDDVDDTVVASVLAAVGPLEAAALLTDTGTGAQDEAAPAAPVDGATRDSGASVLHFPAWRSVAAAALVIVIGVLALRGRGPRVLEFHVALGEPPADATSLTAPGVLANALPGDQVLRGPRSDEYEKAVVSIEAAGRFASAVVVDDEGWLVTSSLAVEDAVRSAARAGEAARVELRGIVDGALGPAVGGSVMRLDPGAGLALVRADDPLRSASPANVTPLVPGDATPSAEALDDALSPSLELVAFGFTATGWGPSGASTTAVRENDSPRPSGPLIETAWTVFPGTSGAGLFEKDAEDPLALRGVTLTGGDDLDAGPYALHVPADLVAALLAEQPSVAEPYPFDPWHDATPEGVERLVYSWSPGAGSSSGSGAGDVFALVDRLASDPAGEPDELTLYLGSAPAPADAPRHPAGLPGMPAGGFAFDVFVHLAPPDGLVVLGTTSTDGDLDAVWLSDDGGLSVRVGWRRAADGAWRVVSDGERSGSPLDHLDAAQRALVQSVLASTGRKDE